MSKYAAAGLPDIDSAPDVFETPDEPESPERRDDESVDERKLPPASRDIDTGELPARRRAVSRFTSSNVTLPTPPEPPLTRLRRLQAEVAQLEAELKAAPPASASAPISARPGARKPVVPVRPRVDVVGELSTLRDKLGSLSGEAAPSGTGDWLARLQQLEVNEKPAVGEVPAAVPAQVSTLDAAEVDKRLTALEQHIGVAQDSDGSSLVDTLNRMDNVLGVLTQPRHLDAISRRVKLLVVDLERATSTARKGGVGVGAAAGVGAGTAAVAAERTPNQDQELQSLFALLPRLDPLLPIIPPLLARLRSLSALHAEALAIAADLRELQSADRAVSEEEGELRAIVAGVQKGITEALGSVAGNWEAVQTRVAALEKRVDALGK